MTELLAEQSEEFDLAQTGPEDMSLLHFTSGTTGTPKAAVHVHGAVVAHYATGHFALDLHAEDIYRCTADPGWVTGTSYGVISPLTHGLTMIVDEGEFDARRWYRTLAEHHVSVWYTAPTAIRMLMRAGPELAEEYDLSSVRFVASVGEPLNPEAVVWGREVLGLTIHDNWWQTETGGIMIANYAACDVYPGSMGQPMPGITAGVLQRGEEGQAQAGPDGHVVEVPAGEIGELALRTGGRLCSAPTSTRNSATTSVSSTVVSDRGPRQTRRERLLLVHRPRRRRDQDRRAPDRAVRGRKCADGGSAGGRSRRDRRARPDDG